MIGKRRLAMAQGLSFVCSTCDRFWSAQQDFPRNLRPCHSPSGCCGSPLVHDTFSDYKGPLAGFRNLCFVCGEPSAFGLQVRNKLGVVGVCRTHVDLVKRLKAQGPAAPPAPTVEDCRVLDDHGAAVKPEPKKKLLSELLLGTTEPDP